MFGVLELVQACRVVRGGCFPCPAGWLYCLSKEWRSEQFGLQVSARRKVFDGRRAGQAPSFGFSCRSFFVLHCVLGAETCRWMRMMWTKTTQKDLPPEDRAWLPANWFHWAPSWLPSWLSVDGRDFVRSFPAGANPLVASATRANEGEQQKKMAAFPLLSRADSAHLCPRHSVFAQAARRRFAARCYRTEGGQIMGRHVGTSAALPGRSPTAATTSAAEAEDGGVDFHPKPRTSPASIIQLLYEAAVS